MASTSLSTDKWFGLQRLLNRSSPFACETGKLPLGEFEPSEELLSAIQNDSKILCVGAGGLGCEILKNLALSGFTDIHVIDLDTIDVSNLNRQFLFRQKDVGRPKAEVAAEFVMKRCPWVNVTPYYGKIQDKDAEFYSQFNVIISGLDNIEARRWLNSLIVSLVSVDENGNVDPETIIPIVDGGTEGFCGQARVIIPKITSCFECSIDSFPPQKVYPLCTIAETPRLPEHCISYAFLVQWPEMFPDRKLDKDSPNDMQWVYEQAKERAEQFGISGVTYMLTMGVVKNIIPAVASTNAIVAAACVNEVFKICTYSSQILNTYMMYMGNAGVYSHTFEYGKKPDCPVCGSESRTISMRSSNTLDDLLKVLISNPEVQLKKPSLASSNQTLYMQNPPALEKATRPNLEKPLSELIQSGDEITVTDPIFPGDVSMTISVNFSD